MHNQYSTKLATTIMTELAKTTTEMTTTNISPSNVATDNLQRRVGQSRGCKNLVQINHLLAAKRSKRASYLAAISLVIAFYIVSNHSHLLRQSVCKNLNTTTQSSQHGGLISMASAAPEPEPSVGASSGRTHHRLPPMNGSIFGKRSVQAIKSAQDKQRQQQHNNDPTVGASQPQSSSLVANYQDIITKIIEDFLALNNESDPEEASVAFCRMIVYECSQMLSARHKAAQRKSLRVDGSASASKRQPHRIQ